MIRRPTGLLRDNSGKAYRVQIERFDERVDHVNRVVVGDPIFQTFRQQRQLGSVRAFYETPHRHLPSTMDESYLTRAFSHSQGQEAVATTRIAKMLGISATSPSD